MVWVGRGCTPSPALCLLPSPLTNSAPPQTAPSLSRECSVTSRLPWACVCGPITSLLGQPCFGHMRLCLQWQVVSPGPRAPPSSWGTEEEDVLGKGVGTQWEGQCSLCGGRLTRVDRIKPGDLGTGSQRGNLVPFP